MTAGQLIRVRRTNATRALGIVGRVGVVTEVIWYGKKEPRHELGARLAIVLHGKVRTVRLFQTMVQPL